MFQSSNHKEVSLIGLKALKSISLGILFLKNDITPHLSENLVLDINIDTIEKSLKDLNFLTMSMVAQSAYHSKEFALTIELSRCVIRLSEIDGLNQKEFALFWAYRGASLAIIGFTILITINTKHNLIILIILNELGPATFREPTFSRGSLQPM